MNTLRAARLHPVIPTTLALLLTSALAPRLSAQAIRLEKLRQQLRVTSKPEKRLRLRLRISEALLAVNLRDAITQARRCAETARANGLRRPEAVALALQSLATVHRAGRDTAKALMQKARQAVPEDAGPILRGRIALMDAELHYFLDEADVAARALEVALRHIDAKRHPVHRAHCLLLLNDLLGSSDFGHESDAEIDNAEQLFRQAPEYLVGPILIKMHRADQEGAAGHEDRADRLAAEALAEAQRIGDRQLESLLLQRQVSRCWRKGRYQNALATGRRILEVARQLGSRSATVVAYDSLAWTQLRQGKPDQAQPHLQAAITELADLDVPFLEFAVIDSVIAAALARRDKDALLESELRRQQLEERLPARHRLSPATAKRLSELRTARQLELRERRRRAAEEEQERLEQESRLKTQEWLLVGAALALLSGVSLVLWFGMRRSRRLNAQLRDEQERARASEAARRELEVRTLQLERRQSVQILAAGVAHEFNNLLGAVVGHADLARKASKAELGPHLEAILDATRRGRHLCDKMLEGAESTPLERRDCDLTATLDRVRPVLEGLLERREDLCIDVPRSSLILRLDPYRIEQVLVNLVANARDASCPGQTIHLRLRELRREDLPELGWIGEPSDSPRYAVLECRDGGAGMGEDQIHRVFDPFYSTRSPGRGLGLSAAQEIVAAHEGAFRVTSSPGAGSTFEIYLPMTPATPAQPDAAPENTASQGTAQGRTVLAIDDEDHLLQIVQRAFARREWPVVTASDGLTGMDKLLTRADEVHLILVDFTMAGMNGAEFVRTMREQGIDAPVVVMSGHDDSFIRSQFPDGDGIEVLLKPFTIAELYASADQALRSGDTSA